MSNTTTETPPGRDADLWRIAQKRASFKSHLATYIIVIGFLWLLWFFTGDRSFNDGIPWPAWATVGWGIGLLFNYLGAYVHTTDAVENEYQKLKNQQSKNL
jgi:hypothetical protein